MTTIQFANDCASLFRAWAISFAREHSLNDAEYNTILHLLIFKYQLNLLRKLEPETI